MSPLRLARLAAAAGALVMAVTSSGDLIVVAVLLGLAAWDPIPALAGMAAAATVWLRLGSTSLGALAGAQAAVGAAVATGPVLAALGSGAAALAVLAGGLAADAPAAAAAAAVAVALADGPGPRNVPLVLARAALTVVAVAAAAVLSRRRVRGLRALALVAATGGVVAVSIRFGGRWTWPPTGMLVAHPAIVGGLRAVAGALGAAVVAAALPRRPAAPPLRLPTPAPPLR